MDGAARSTGPPSGAEVADRDLLMDLLNSAPVVNGRVCDQLDVAGASVSFRHGGSGSPGEIRHLRAVRDALHDLIRGTVTDTAPLVALMGSAILVPEAAGEQLEWVLHCPDDEHLAIRAAMAWSQTRRAFPGRLRPCANVECNLFLLDRSRPGNARWCSMATCGNRTKVRAAARRRSKP